MKKIFENLVTSAQLQSIIYISAEKNFLLGWVVREFIAGQNLGRTDGRTDGQTDRQTDKPQTIAYFFLKNTLKNSIIVIDIETGRQ